MIVPNQIIVPVRIGTVVRDFGTGLYHVRDQITEPRTNYESSVRKTFGPCRSEPITNRWYDHPWEILTYTNNNLLYLWAIS